ncbi:1-aminocyclopropane-1-carboxylate synthase-like protein 2 [Zootermopsis nevadensis]|uniref:1-aminocyclopropane-1-carboxylate synthase-like protein 2 n=1 Tax=Zootermopsis nevadensis TaxID=136037 RepID=A0A067RAY1_ZOONE|nr:1-aminocyclopropane-1-carboxylate synthase-like protein 2 [Zootermopsis nevadensis]
MDKREDSEGILVNPNNPLGEVYGPKLVLQLMEVCHRYGLHFISDEAYALSIYELQTAFQSVLSQPSLPDPQKTHVFWSFSKVCINTSGALT